MASGQLFDFGIRAQHSGLLSRGVIAMFYYDLPDEITCWRRTWEQMGLGPQVNGDPMFAYQAAQLLYARAEYKAAELAFREVVARVPDHLPSLRWLVALLRRSNR